MLIRPLLLEPKSKEQFEFIYFFDSLKSFDNYLMFHGDNLKKKHTIIDHYTTLQLCTANNLLDVIQIRVEIRNSFTSAEIFHSMVIIISGVLQTYALILHVYLKRAMCYFGHCLIYNTLENKNKRFFKDQNPPSPCF